MVTEARIRRTRTDKALFKLLSSELQRRLPHRPHETIAIHAARIAALPRGLRAMAAIYQLDVSMTLDDLGWHFANWHSKRYARETERGLRELGAGEAADVFAAALKVASKQWPQFGNASFVDWYHGSAVQKRMEPLNRRLFAIHERSREYGLMSYWLEYARRSPEHVAQSGRSSNKRMQLTKRTEARRVPR